MTAESLINLILLFFAYAFLGWCIEVTLKYFQFHRFINRGFLTGPWLPIYGSGAALITIAVKGLSPLESSVGTTFMVSFILCGVVEYMTSFVLEKRFHARWWDYSQKPMNLHGRVWIGNLILFGLGGVLIVEMINPLLLRLSGHLSFILRETLAIILSSIFTADYVMSHFVLKLVKTGVENSEADDTEAINKEIRLLLNDRSFFHRRFAEAYPEVLYRTERIAARVEAIKAETERLRLEAELRVAEVKHEVEVNLEPTALVKNTIIEKQEALIDLLYQEDTASDEMKALKHEVEEKQAVLQKRRDLLPKL
ncbi:MAG: putative ABC transporter permease [Lachnospiraceae bacterium]|nr:putative ABC transporter permease [Lachnospiraceae bacterium]